LRTQEFNSKQAMNMKRHLFFRGLALAALSALVTGFAMGCGPQASQTANPAQQQEISRLRAENQELAQARLDNEEVQRLKQENQDLAKIRSQYQEASRLKKENEQLRQQVARFSPAAAAAAAEAAAAVNPVAGANPGQVPGTELIDTNAVALAEGHINEADDIMVEPKQLQQLLPDFDWEKLGRTEPLGIKALLERDGVQITNVAQLKEYGITNFIIQRAPTTNAPASAGENR
jgi:hypothetical protein